MLSQLACFLGNDEGRLRFLVIGIKNGWFLAGWEMELVCYLKLNLGLQSQVTCGLRNVLL